MDIPITGEAARAEASKANDPAQEPMMQFFKFDNLPNNLRTISAEFYTLACWTVVNLPRNAERTVALRKLLEAKDCAVRAFIMKL